MDSFGLPEGLMDQVTVLLRRYPKIASAKVFGSRAKGNCKMYSDVDIALFVDDSKVVSSIRDELEELDTIYTFDILDYHQTKSTEIKAHIDRVGIEILTPEESP
jgi:uncharacterized protein